MTAAVTAQPPVPDAFVGAWERVGLSIDGGPLEETADVLWLQSPHWFADLRTDRATGQVTACFAGITTWTPPTLRWNRHIDLVEVDHDDVGHIEWDGDDLVESGVFPFPGTDGPATYLERWRRLPDDRPVRAMAEPGRVFVQAGVHALEVVSIGGTVEGRRRELTSRGWVASS